MFTVTTRKGSGQVSTALFRFFAAESLAIVLLCRAMREVRALRSQKRSHRQKQLRVLAKPHHLTICARCPPRDDPAL